MKKQDQSTNKHLCKKENTISKTMREGFIKRKTFELELIVGYSIKDGAWAYWVLNISLLNLDVIQQVIQGDINHFWAGQLQDQSSDLGRLIPL